MARQMKIVIDKVEFSSILQVAEAGNIIYAIEKHAQFIDDHMVTTPRQMPYNHFVICKHRNVYHLCPYVENTPLFSINPLYLEDGVVHLSRSSIAGIIRPEPNVATHLETLITEGVISGYVSITY